MTRHLAWARLAALAMLGLASAALLSACSDSSDDSSLSGGVTQAQAAAAAPGDLAGTWILDAEASDLPPRGGPGGPGGRGSQGFGGQGGGQGGPGGGPGGPGGMHGRGRGGPGGAMSDTLVIVETDSTVTLTHGDRPERVLYTDGRTVTHEGPHGGTAEVTASWVDGALVVVHTRDEFSHTQTFTVSEDGQVLTVAVAGEGPQGGRSHTRVYNRN